jgi:farnesyl diphosphate synthase
VDDILDATASTETLGKTAGKDARSHKPTFVSVLGIVDARSFADELLEDAVDALQPLGGKGRRLEELARYIVARDR